MTLARKSLNYNATPPAADALRVSVPAACAGQRLDHVLSLLLPQFSRSRLAQWIRDRRVELDGGQPVLPKTKVWGGEEIAVHPVPDPATTTATAEEIALEVIHEDAAVLVIDKPAGLVVHPGRGNWSGTLLNALLAHSPQLATLPRAGIVHRLDKETSGLLVVAKTLEAQTSLVRQLQARTVKREYLALVHGRVTRDGKVEAPIGRHPVQRTRMAVAARGRPSITHYEVLQHCEGQATLLRCRLETGRTHQIRVHMLSLGHPLVGDPVYGKSRRSALALLNVFKRQALHAARLSLQHPDNGETMTWEAALPPDFAQLLDALGAAPVV